MSTDANSFQIGGSHYQGKGEQHWDIMIRFAIPYTLGCATKYLWRWRDKNGIQDLEKALHYLQKTKESMPIIMDTWIPIRIARDSLPESIGQNERNIIALAMSGDLFQAITYLEKFIAEMKAAKLP